MGRTPAPDRGQRSPAGLQPRRAASGVRPRHGAGPPPGPCGNGGAPRVDGGHGQPPRGQARGDVVCHPHRLDGRSGAAKNAVRSADVVCRSQKLRMEPGLSPHCLHTRARGRAGGRPGGGTHAGDGTRVLVACACRMFPRCYRKAQPPEVRCPWHGDPVARGRGPASGTAMHQAIQLVVMNNSAGRGHRHVAQAAQVVTGQPEGRVAHGEEGVAHAQAIAAMDRFAEGQVSAGLAVDDRGLSLPVRTMTGGRRRRRRHGCCCCTCEGVEVYTASWVVTERKRERDKKKRATIAPPV